MKMHNFKYKSLRFTRTMLNEVNTIAAIDFSFFAKPEKYLKVEAK